MDGTNHTFFKFMCDLIDSGAWAALSVGARTLYPVLCRFSDESFKMVWPGTETLLRLTGFKCKKSLQAARKDLEDAGLLLVRPGSGRTTSQYHFRFDYPNSKVDIDTYRAEIIARRGAGYSTPGGDVHPPEQDDKSLPNYINIHINPYQNNQVPSAEIGDSLKRLDNLSERLERFLANIPTPDHKTAIINSLRERYGELEIGEAIQIAVRRGKDGDIRYLEGILRNRSEPATASSHSGIDTTRLPGSLAKVLPMLDLQYQNKGILYFSTKHDLDKDRIEQEFQQCGYDVRIFRLHPGRETRSAGLA